MAKIFGVVEANLRIVTSTAVLLSLSLAGCANPYADGPAWSLMGSRAVPIAHPEPVSSQTSVGQDAATSQGLATQEPRAPHLRTEVTPLAPPMIPSSARNRSATAGGVTNVVHAAPTKTADGRTVVSVQTGDTLSSIAATHRVSVAGLMFANNMRNPAVQPGMKLVLPPR
jgi:LysM repeat protein